MTDRRQRISTTATDVGQSRRSGRSHRAGGGGIRAACGGGGAAAAAEAVFVSSWLGGGGGSGARSGCGHRRGELAIADAVPAGVVLRVVTDGFGRHEGREGGKR